MPSTGAARAKMKVAQVDVTVTVKNGEPSPADVNVRPEGTVQFVNEDTNAYRVRLWTRDGDWHADIDILLPARSGITVMVDPATTNEGECYYELFNTSTYATLKNSGHGRKKRHAVKTAAATRAALTAGTSSSTKANTTGGGSGGGTIKIGGH